MSDSATTPKTPKAATTPKTPKKATTAKKGMNKTWMIVGVLIVLALAGVNFYYMKKNKDLKNKLEAAKANNGSGANMDTIETDETDPINGDKEPVDGSTSGTPQ